MYDIFETIRDFLDRGGQVIVVISWVIFIMWAMIIERVLYLRTEHRQRVREAFDELNARSEKHLAERLVAQRPHRLVAFRLESEVVEYLKRMYYFAKRIAKLVRDDPRPAPHEEDEVHPAAEEVTV